MLRLQQPIWKDVSVRSVAAACLIMIGALAGREALEPLLPRLSPFITLYPAVALAGLLCGPITAAGAGLLGIAAAVLLWMPPRMAFAFEGLTEGVSIVLFVAASSLVIWAASALRARLDAARVAGQMVDLGLAAGGVGTFGFDLRTERITASATAFALHGLTPGERTTAEDWLRDIHPDDAPAARAALRAVVEAGTPASFTYRVLGGRDGVKWVAARGRVVSAGGERRLVCALVDVTEQIRVQEALQRERERLRLALEAGALAVWDYDPAAGSVHIDTQYAVTMGFETGADTVTLATIMQRVHPADAARIAAELASIEALGPDYRSEFRIVTPAGRTRWVASQGIRLKGSDGGSDGGSDRVIGIIQDISDRKRREGDLLELAARRALLVREADHRIKNSLQLVVSMLSLQAHELDDGVAKDALRGAITRVGAIALSHRALQGSEDLRRIDLALTLRDLGEQAAQMNPAIAIVCRPGETLMLDADRAIPLALAVNELLTNALRHAFTGRAAGTVALEASIQGSELIVRVRDDGVGMPPRSRIGGLGTTIIDALVAPIGANVAVESAPQEGTVVTCRLPLLPEETAALAAA